MATTDTEPKASERDESSDSGAGSDSDEDNDSSGQEQIEWLATSRAKRSTAGNRMKSMLANENPVPEDDDLELLFVEDADDAGFTDVDKDDSDLQMDSSSDEEDNDENADDLEGEKELERQAKAKRAAQRKRKAQEAIPAKFRKKVRIEQPETRSATPSSTGHPSQNPRPKKKSERLSWLPTASDLPTRSSDRKTTRINKEQLHRKMVEDEIKRKKLAESMAKKQARLEALKKPPMTQEQRLAEAAIIEKRNSKSLNRWEEAEKQREEERLRKIAALHSRKLDGPVVTFYSGNQELEAGLMKHVGKMVSIEEKAPRQPRKKKQSAAEALAEKEGEAAKTEDSTTPGQQSPAPSTAAPAETSETTQKVKQEPETTEKPLLEAATTPSAADGANSTAKPEEPPATTSSNKNESNSLADPAQQEAQQPPQEPVAETTQQPSPPAQPAPTEPVPTEQASAELTSTEPAPTQPASQPETGPSPGPVASPSIAPLSVMAPPSGAMVPPAASMAPSPATMAPPSGSMAPPPIPSPQEIKPVGSGVLAAPVLAHPMGMSPSMLGGQMPMLGFAPPSMKSNVLALPNTSSPGPSPLSLPPSTPTPPPAGPVQTVPAGTPAAPDAPAPSVSVPPPNPAQPPQRVKRKYTKRNPAPEPEPELEPDPEPPMEGKVTRSCIILQNFDDEAIKDKQVQSQILFGRRMSKLGKPAHTALCAITNHPARYRDPKTGLPFYNSYAFKEIQRLHHGDYKYSRLIGGWVGPGTYAAKGVPERFLDPTKKRTVEEPKKATKEGGEKEDKEEGQSEAADTQPKQTGASQGKSIEGKGTAPAQTSSAPTPAQTPAPTPATVPQAVAQ